MKSIRLSLIVYFLLLLAAALGGVSLFTFQTARAALRDKIETTRALLETQKEEHCRSIKEEVDTRMLRRAHTLAKMAQSQFGGNRFEEVYPAELVAAGTNPLASLALAQWAQEVRPSLRGWLGFHLTWTPSIKISFADAILPREGEDREIEYFQTYSDNGIVLQRSHSLGDHEFRLDPSVRSRIGLLEWDHDDTELPPGVHLRRVTLKAPVTRSRVIFQAPLPRAPGAPRRPVTPQPGRIPGAPKQNKDPDERGLANSPTSPKAAVQGSRPPNRVDDRTAPAIFIQCAVDTRERDQAIRAIEENHAQELGDLESHSADSLASLRNRLLATSLGTFAAAVAGCFLLVGAGLSPLRRLSAAVSQVSEKDFRLQFHEKTLPLELQPIVEKLTEALEQLQRAFAREKQAAADISHELRTPVAALLTTLEVALRKTRSAEEYRELMRDCHATGQQLSRLVERILALARLDARVDTLRVRTIDAQDLAEQCATLIRPLAEARGLKLRLRDGGPAPLHTDPDKLREVVTNLLHNAIEYNRPNGSVELRVERQNGQLRLEVEDTGIGIAPDAREHIFERFYRVDPARQAEGIHAGLGLSIVKGYVDLMGGKIEVQSEEGCGSVFRLDLPATAA